MLAAVFDSDVPQSVDEKRAFLLAHHVALWDVIASCEVTGSSDSSIRSVTPNDLSVILGSAPIRRIYVNGRTAEAYYKRYTEAVTGRSATCMPSTSPANAAWSLNKLVGAWSVIKDSEK